MLSEISLYCLSHNVQYFLIGGDLNTDISRINTITLKHFISNECLQLAILSNMSSVTYTFISALNTNCLIYHFIFYPVYLIALESCIKATGKAISQSKPLCINKCRTIIPG